MSAGKDMVTTRKNYETTFGYKEERFTKEGVIAFFKEYRSVKEKCMYSYDVHALDLLTIFEQALMSDALHPDERVAVALIYGLELTYVQTKKIMGLKLTELRKIVDNAFETIEAVLNGYKHKSKNPKPSKARNINEYIQEILAAKILIFDINDEVFHSLLHMTREKDDKADASLMQFSSGNEEIKDKFNIYGTHEYDVANYTHFATSPRSNEYDYFRSQDKHFEVQATETIDHLSKGLTIKGRRTVKQTKRDETSNGGNGKGFIY
jgi:hypothetical protein